MTPIWLSQLGAHLRNLFPAGVSSGMPAKFPDEVTLVDRRKYAMQAHGPKREWKVKWRSWKKVTGICLHQTACHLGENDERWDAVGAHLGVTCRGKLEWLHDFNRNVAAANGWNEECVSIEIDGRYEGIVGNLATLWDDPSTSHREMPMPLTDPAIFTTLATIDWIVERVAANGGRVRALVSHRQSSAMRPSDPGEAIWKAIALPASKKHGLSDGGPGFKLGGGRPTPRDWDPSRIERY